MTQKRPTMTSESHNKRNANQTPYRTPSEHSPLRGYLVDWLNGYSVQNSVAVTLTMRQRSKFGERLTESDQCSRNFRYFINRLCRKVTGRRYKRNGERLQVIPVIEKKPGSRFHYHAIIEDPRNDLDKMRSDIVDCWIKTDFGNRQTYVEKTTNQIGWISYILKLENKDDELDILNLNYSIAG